MAVEKLRSAAYPTQRMRLMMIHVCCGMAEKRKWMLAVRVRKMKVLAMKTESVPLVGEIESDLGQINPVPATRPSHFSKINLNIILPCTPGSSKCSREYQTPQIFRIIAKYRFLTEPNLNSSSTM